MIENCYARAMNKEISSSSHVFRRFVGNFFLRITLSYLVIATGLVLGLDWAASHFGLPILFVRATAVASGFVFIIVVWFAWGIRSASPHDRGMWTVFLAWIYGPLLVSFVFNLTIGSLFTGTVGGGLITPISIACMFVSGIWAKISRPFALSWVRQNVRDEVGLTEVEENMSWPLTVEEATSIEIRISRRLYYTFLLGIFGLLFVLIETAANEYLGALSGSVGFRGDALIAILIAIFMVPLNSWANRHFAIESTSDSESVLSEVQSALLNAIGVIGRSAKIQLRHWYAYVLIAVATITALAVIVWLLIAFEV